MWVHLFGTINSIMIFISLYGVFSQLRTIQRAKLQHRSSTRILSQNQFIMSYLAYFSFFFYGAVVTPFNHYLVWPRLAATLLVLGILYEMWRDRQNKRACASFSLAASTTLLGLIGLMFIDSFIDSGRFISTVLIVCITLLLAQGYAHQIALIIKNRSTGNVDIKMSQFILMMDISTLLLALAMGLEDGWPLMLLASVSALTKLIIMYLFRWVSRLPEQTTRTV